MRPYCLHRKRHSVLCGDLTGKEIKKEGIYVYIQLILFAVSGNEHSIVMELFYKKSPSSILTMNLYLKNWQK